MLLLLVLPWGVFLYPPVDRSFQHRPCLPQGRQSLAACIAQWTAVSPESLEALDLCDRGPTRSPHSVLLGPEAHWAMRLMSGIPVSLHCWCLAWKSYFSKREAEGLGFIQWLREVSEKHTGRCLYWCLLWSWRKGTAFVSGMCWAVLYGSRR